MKLRSKLFFSALICLTLALLILLKKEKSVKISSIENSTVIDHVQNQNAAVQSSNQNKSVAITSEKNNSGSKTTNAQKNEEQTDQQGPLSAQEVESVHNIVKMISRTIAQKSNSNQFMKAIQNLHLTPKFIDEGNNNLGSMVTVRTSNSLEGTRYIHAQFTGPKNNADYLQHISFQIRPGSNSFQKAVEILNEYLPKNKVIKESTSDYVLYNTEDGYVAWAKIATREDLKSNKYNASSKEDIGTVIVTIEQEIHDMDDEDHHHN